MRKVDLVAVGICVPYDDAVTALNITHTDEVGDIGAVAPAVITWRSTHASSRLRAAHPLLPTATLNPWLAGPVPVTLSAALSTDADGIEHHGHGDRLDSVICYHDRVVRQDDEWAAATAKNRAQNIPLSSLAVTIVSATMTLSRHSCTLTSASGMSTPST